MAGAAGYYMSSSSLVVNKLNSPILRSAVISSASAAVGHLAGGTAAGMLEGHSFHTSLNSSFDGLWQDVAIGGAIGIASTIGTCYANKVSPWVHDVSFHHECDETIKNMRIWGTQGGINNEMVNYYLSQMTNGTFTNKKISVMKYNDGIYITDGHCRMVAAYRYYQKTGETFYIDK